MSKEQSDKRGEETIPPHDPSEVYGLPMTEDRIYHILGERFDPYSENFRKARKAVWAILHEISRATSTPSHVESISSECLAEARAELALADKIDNAVGDATILSLFRQHRADIVRALRGESAPSTTAPTEAPVAWMVFTSGPAEHEYLVYAEEQVAEHVSAAYGTEVIPLYRAQSFAASAIARNEIIEECAAVCETHAFASFDKGAILMHRKDATAIRALIVTTDGGKQTP